MDINEYSNYYIKYVKYKNKKSIKIHPKHYQNTTHIISEHFVRRRGPSLAARERALGRERVGERQIAAPGRDDRLRRRARPESRAAARVSADAFVPAIMGLRGREYVETRVLGNADVEPIF